MIFLRSMLKKVFGIFLVIVLLIQVLPVKQIGALLCNDQLTEETAQSDDIEKDTIKKIDFKSDFILSEPNYTILTNSSNSISYIHFSEGLPSNHSGDIHVPPPNC